MGIEDTLDTALARAVREAKSQSAFARLIGRSQATVHGWMRDGKALPGEFVLKVEAFTGISRHDLRPDLYPRDSVTTSRALGAATLEAAR